MIALDLFCGAGGAAKGLQRAGYRVVGIDIQPQKRYCGDEFVLGNAFDYLAHDLSSFDLIWASPKCQAHSCLTPIRSRSDHEIQLPKVLDFLRNQSVPYVVENVDGAQHLMHEPVMLCGTMFGLNIWRHRWFEIGNVPGLFFLLPKCAHIGHPVLISGRGMLGVARGEQRPKEPSVTMRKAAIGIDWMTGKELDQAIPPAYSEFLGCQIRDYQGRYHAFS